MKNEGLPHPYQADELGLYNEPVYQQTGEKFRPIDIRNGRVVVLTPGIVHDISERRNRKSGLK